MRYGLATFAIAGVLAAACGNAATAGGTDQGRRVEITMKEFAFAPNTLSLKSGEKVRLVFKQGGTLEHEFMAGREPMKDMGYMEDLFAGVDHEILPKPAADHGMGHGAERVGVRVQPGTTSTLAFIVPARPGAYEFACFVPGHYESGMKGTLTIE